MKRQNLVCAIVFCAGCSHAPVEYLTGQHCPDTRVSDSGDVIGVNRVVISAATCIVSCRDEAIDIWDACMRISARCDRGAEIATMQEACVNECFVNAGGRSEQLFDRLNQSGAVCSFGVGSRCRWQGSGFVGQLPCCSHEQDLVHVHGAIECPPSGVCPY